MSASEKPAVTPAEALVAARAESRRLAAEHAERVARVTRWAALHAIEVEATGDRFVVRRLPITRGCASIGEVESLLRVLGMPRL